MAIAVSGIAQQSDVLFKTVLVNKMIEKWYAQSIIANISSTAYQADILAAGDSIHIPLGGEETVNTYAKGMTINYEDITSSNIVMVIDKAIYSASARDKIDISMDKTSLMNALATRRTAKFANRVDSDALGYMYTAVDAANQGLTAGKRSASVNLGAAGAPVQITRNNIIEYLVRINQVLAEQDMPAGYEKFVVMTEWMESELRLSPTLNAANVSGLDQAASISGQIAKLGSLTLYRSNLVPSVVDAAASNKVCYHIIAGWKESTAFAGQVIDEGTMIDLQNKFAIGQRQLYIYGFKVVKPEGLVHLYASQT